MSALDDIAAERIRQLDEKGYDAERDDGYVDGQLAQGAAAFALPPGWTSRSENRVDVWPLDDQPSSGFAATEEFDARRVELVKAGAMLAAEIDRMDRARAGVPQAYLPKAVCYAGHTIQCAIEIRAELLAFLKRHPHLRVFSGLRIGDAGDHRCGYATDLVPLDYGDRGAVANAFADAGLMLSRGEVAYVEPLSATWIPGNHHLHVSWKRCP